MCGRGDGYQHHKILIYFHRQISPLNIESKKNNEILRTAIQSEIRALRDPNKIVYLN